MEEVGTMVQANTQLVAGYTLVDQSPAEVQNCRKVEEESSLVAQQVVQYSSWSTVGEASSLSLPSMVEEASFLSLPSMVPVHQPEDRSHLLRSDPLRPASPTTLEVLLFAAVVSIFAFSPTSFHVARRKFAQTQFRHRA